MPEVPYLTCVLGQLEGRRFLITEAGVRIGREPGNEIRIGDKGVSRQHARVILHNGLLWVQDMGSRNGVFVNEVRVQNQGQANVGDTVRVGVHVFRIDLESGEPEVSRATAEQRQDLLTLGSAAAASELGTPERSNKWSYIVAFFIVALLAAAVALMGTGSGRVWRSF
jgi:ABC transport system ATP-binding/permease protein